MTTVTGVTADELLRANIPNKRVELVRGVPKVSEPAGLRHGRVVTELARRLGNHVAAHDVGCVYTGDSGFVLARDPDTVRAPDIAFLQRDRLPVPEPAGFPALAPDLVAEILSPSDGPGEVLAKVADWIAAGTRLVWVIDPERRIARVYRLDGSGQIVTEDLTLVGEDVIPGFSCPLADIL